MSGGADSLALLLMMAAQDSAACAVATVDHGLRAEAAQEAEAVARICAVRGLAHRTLRLDLASGPAVQERARQARYAALDRWCDEHDLAALVTAHHADDQAETLVMRLNRGAGLRGLGGMRPVAPVPGGSRLLLRPLLGWRREDLRAIVRDSGEVPCDDPSNRDARFERVRVRAGLAEAAWIEAAGVAASAAHLAEADAALDWAARQVALGGDGDTLTCPADLPRALALRVLERVVVAFSGEAPARGTALARWHDHLASGAVATLAGVRGEGGAVVWRFTRARAHRA